MNYLNYFAKNGFIYGVSYKPGDGDWTGYAIKFTDLDKAEHWLEEEEYDFRYRMLCSKTKASVYREIDEDGFTVW